MLPTLRRISLWFGLIAAATLSAEIKIGDSYAQVLQEKGLPESKIESGTIHVLRYPNQTIKLDAGVVVAVQSATHASIAVAAPRKVAAVAEKPRPAVAPEVAPLKWRTDYAAALAQAKADNRHVFLFFTGSDWCGWCKRLNAEILTTPEFARFAQEKLVLVEIDFPKKHPQPAALKTQNAKLAKRYNIEGYPTVIVLDGTGTKVNELGYQEGGPNPFIERLSKL